MRSRAAAGLSVALCLLLPVSAAHAGLGASPEAEDEAHTAPDACGGSCPGDAAEGCPGEPSSAGPAAGSESCEGQCPGDAPDGSCPVGCDDCTCCFAALPFFVPATSFWIEHGPPARLAVPGDLDELTAGVRSRIYRPPRLALAC